MIIDFHTHILPGIDDGSRSIEMTQEMLVDSARQGIDVMIASPHFYADSMTIENFLANRDFAFDKVEPMAQELGIKLIAGGEIAFFSNMSKADDIERLCLKDTRYMLLEMPFRPWNKYDLDEVDHIIMRGITPIVAHIERFFGFQKDKEIVNELMEKNVIVQVNAECMIERSTRRLGIKLFKNGYADILGSDCHNLSGRKQNLEYGRRILEKKIRNGVLEDIDELGEYLLRDIL